MAKNVHTIGTEKKGEKMSGNYSQQLKDHILKERRNVRSVLVLAADYEPHQMTTHRNWIQLAFAVPERHGE